MKGSALHKECDRYGYIYQTQAPYQVLANHFISYGQILKLSRIEKLLDWYYNSGDFRRTIAYIGQEIYAGMAMQFYQEFSDYWLRQGLLQIGHRKEAYYSYLQSFISENHPTHGEAINDLLKYDYLCGNNKYGLPNGLISYNPIIVNEQIYSYTKNRSFVDQYLPALRSRTPREIKKLLHIEYLRIDPETFAHAVIDLALMFVYNPISRVAEKVICLNNL